MQAINDSIHKLIHAHAYAFGVFVALFSFVFFAGGLVVANGQSMGPSDSHVVSLYVDGDERIMPSRAQTVGDFLNSAGVPVGEFDLVEPAVTTPIENDSFSIQIYRARPVTIVDGNKQERVMTPYTTEKVVAEKAGFAVHEEDNLAFSDPEGFVETQILGQKLTIDRATPVTVSLYGTPAAPYRTHADTVGELLDEKNITPEAGATITPAPETPLTPNAAIFISKYGKQVVTKDEEVAFPIDSSADATQPLGKITVISAGKKGKKQVVYELTLRDGKEVARTKIQEVVTSEPVKQVQTRGTKNTVVTGSKVEWMQAAGIPESDYMYVDYIIGHESGWGYLKSNKAGSGAYGLCQALPGKKMASAGADWETNPVTQLKWCSGYAKGRYGSWAGAYNFWLNSRWW